MAANSPNGAPARLAAPSSTSSTSVTLRHTITSVPAACSTRASVSTQMKVAAWPRWVTSYGVMPQAYTRARPTSGSGVPFSVATVGSLAASICPIVRLPSQAPGQAHPPLPRLAGPAG